MAAPTLQTLGRLLRTSRDTRGIRDVARKIGISPATLSRVERGHLPDLETFRKVCTWLKVDPGEVLRVKSPSKGGDIAKVAVHFKKPQAISPTTAQALSQMILAAQRAILATEAPPE